MERLIGRYAYLILEGHIYLLGNSDNCPLGQLPPKWQLTHGAVIISLYMIFAPLIKTCFVCILMRF